MLKDDVANALEEIADLLEIDEVPFKPRAYRRAAREVRGLTEDLAEVHKQGKLEEIPAVGENIAEKMAEIIERGKLEYLEQLREQVPVDTELMEIQGIGPKTVKKFYQKLDVKNLPDLEKRLQQGRVRDLSGFGPKREQNIKKGLELYKESKARTPLKEALPLAGEIEKYLEESGLFNRLLPAGSLRRRKATVGDIDILGLTDEPKRATDHFLNLPAESGGPITEIISRGEKRSSVRIERGLQVDLRLVAEESFGSAAQYFTGSQAHNVRLRELALSQGYSLNEYGLFEKKEDEIGERVTGEREEEIYEKLGLDFIPPELREDRGEIGAAEEGKLPRLIDQGDLRGDLHCHSTQSSDGTSSLSELARKAIELEYDYLAITDHSTESGIIEGIDEDNFQGYSTRIKEANEKYDSLRLLAGVEANIKRDGEVDLPPWILEELDFVIASIHSNFGLPAEEMTARTVKAMENPYVDLIGHPTGKKRGQRPPFELEWERIFERARETETALEINASPTRMDLNDSIIKSAVEAGVRLAIGTDSHRVESLEDVEMGVYLARRGWCEKEDLLNAAPPGDWLR